jgi:hypothetical protein
MKQGKRKTRAVRMLDHAVRLAIANAGIDMSDMANGRLASNLSKDVHRLNRLAQDDPENLFWDTLQKTIIKLVKFVQRTRC